MTMPTIMTRVMRATRRHAYRVCAAGAFLVSSAAELQGQWVQQHEQFYLQAPHNWVFRSNYQAADRLFNAFDYGHAILYEKLWTKPYAPASELEEKEYDFLTKKVLVRPPRVPLEEGAIEIAYVQLAPEAKQMFEWAHILHRQMYDVLADERLTQAQKDSEMQRLIGYYKTRPDVAFSSRPKSMELMQEQPYSLAFRQKYPKFNGLIWAYHWLQVGLYEPLLVGRSPEERQSLVRATVARFFQMLTRPVEGMPHQMPMTAAIAPQFAARYPEAAIIFDNLHSMHDVISDILANPQVPRDRKRAEVLRAARLYRDDTSYVMPVEAWRNMSRHMGVENMGGPSVGFLPELPAPTVTYGAVMTHDERTGEMVGFKYGSAVGGVHAGHGGAAGATPTGAQAVNAHADHGAMETPGTRPVGDSADAHAGHARMNMGAGMGGAHDSASMALHMRMMEDPVIRQRIQSDTAMRRMMSEMMEQMPAEHREHMQGMMQPAGAPGGAASSMRIPVTKSAGGSTSPNAPARRTAGSSPAPATRTTSKPVAKPAAKEAPRATPKPAPKPVDPHAGHRP